MATKQDINATLARLAEAFPQTFVLEKYRPHRALKVGIAADLTARCPAIERRALNAVLRSYAQRVMYLKAMIVPAGMQAVEVRAGRQHRAALLRRRSRTSCCGCEAVSVING